MKDKKHIKKVTPKKPVVVAAETISGGDGFGGCKPLGQ